MVNTSGGGGLLSYLCTAIGNFSVAYNFTCISVALIVMSATVCTSNDDNCREGTQASWVASAESSVVFLGAICGQLVMGYAGDVLGRGRALGFTLAIAAVGALLSAAAPAGPPTTVYVIIIIFRFIMGVGVGGVYPISAAKAAEDFGSQAKVNLSAAGWSFLWQIPGAGFTWLLGYILASSTLPAHVRWRLLLGVGSIPAALVVALSILEDSYRTTTTPASYLSSSSSMESHKSPMSSNPAQPASNGVTLSIIDRESASNSPMHDSIHLSPPSPRSSRSRTSIDVPDVSSALRKPEFQRKLIVTGGCWFVYDVCNYGVLLFSSQLLSGLLPTTDDDVSSAHHMDLVAPLQMIALLFGLPASIATIYALKYFHVKQVQVVGFLLISLGFLMLVVAEATLSSSIGLFCFYVLLEMSLMGGASMTTFVLPAEVYPAHIRSSLNGISAAMGKLGAFVGAFLFGAVADASSFSVVMIICCILALGAAVVSQVLLDGPEGSGGTKESLHVDLDDI